ncbi:hypothetical protein KKF91_21805 [Myxococcota bacterium]|nr:hypothetical protein [Myxococcota bacterium]MBU1433181.1 hypothetical protein [Myxococcota bacterium]MBU1896194.1 hypothetical protein [Myxococcota bacterium]
MLTFYLISGIIGGSLVVLSALGGLGDHDAELELDHDVDLDADVDIEAEADVDIEAGVDHDGELAVNAWIPFLSMRFWTYCAAGFGLTGGVLTGLGALGEPAVGLAAGGTGLVAGLGMSYAMRLLRRGEAHGHGVHEYPGAEGIVRVAIPPGGVGKIRVTLRGEELDLLAVSDASETLPLGAPVVIVEMVGPQAKVVHRGIIMGG